MLTLEQFLTQHGIPLRQYGKRAGCYQIFDSEVPRDALWDLYHLADYYVSSSVSGPSRIVCVRVQALEPFFTGGGK
jgi:hypothetical protein